MTTEKSWVMMKDRIDNDQEKYEETYFTSAGQYNYTGCSSAELKGS